MKTAETKGLEKTKTETKNRIALVVIILSELLFVVSAVMLLKYYLAYRSEKKLSQMLAEVRVEDQKETAGRRGEKATEENNGDSDLIDRSQLLVMNEDYLMWLTIPDTEINYPVVQRDNEYYLNHDFLGEKSSHGTIFLDENCADGDDMLLLHGHHMKDGTMFGGLKAYKKADFTKEHTALYLDFGSGDEEYRIFAVALVDLGSETHFPYYEMPEDAEGKKDYLEKLKKASFWYQDEDGRSGKDNVRVVLLSTCEYGTADQRLVVAAVKSEP